MLLARSLLTLALAAGGGSLAYAAPPVAVRTAAEPPAEPRKPPPASVDGVVAVRVPVAHHDVHALSAVLKDIFAVRPDRGDVRAILHDSREATLIVFATPAGHASVRRVLDRLLQTAP